MDGWMDGMRFVCSLLVSACSKERGMIFGLRAGKGKGREEENDSWSGKICCEELSVALCGGRTGLLIVATADDRAWDYEEGDLKGKREGDGERG